jgi:hypothetical protein
LLSLSRENPCLTKSNTFHRGWYVPFSKIGVGNILTVPEVFLTEKGGDIGCLRNWKGRVVKSKSKISSFVHLTRSEVLSVLDTTSKSSMGNSSGISVPFLNFGPRNRDDSDGDGSSEFY